MNPIGVMQGRLSPPVGGRIQAFPKTTWREEFAAARDCGLSLIEWIIEADECEKNPLLAEPDAVLELSRRAGVGIQSVCADYFMDLPLVRGSAAEQAARLAMLERVIVLCGRLGVRYLTIPFVDASAIDNDADFESVVSSLGCCLPSARRHGVALALETALDPRRFAQLLARLNHSHAKVNYDIGNSASFGYDTREEIAAYGKDICTVHVKDRVRGGTTVPLGEGDADFDATFAALARAGFSGPFILQAARRGDERQAARAYVDFVNVHLARHFSAHEPRARR